MPIDDKVVHDVAALSRLKVDANDLHSLFSTFTKIHGNHSLKFGVDYRLVRYNSANQGTSAAGSFSFSPTFTQADPFTASSANTSGTAMALREDRAVPCDVREEALDQAPDRDADYFRVPRVV